MAVDPLVRFPIWARTVGALREAGVEVKAICWDCSSARLADLDALIRIKGAGYSLVDRRTRCTFTEGCKGWVRFYYRHGMFRQLWTPEATERWCAEDSMARRKAAEQAAREPAPALLYSIDGNGDVIEEKAGRRRRVGPRDLVAEEMVRFLSEIDFGE